MIPFRHQEQLLDEIVRGLSSTEHPCSYNIVAPPGFLNQRQFAQLVLARLAEVSPSIPAAAIATDSLEDLDAYADSLAQQWGRSNSSSSRARIDSLLDGLACAPAIQVICYFEKIVHQFDLSILGKLRDAEADHALRSLTISYYSYNKLRDRWREQNIVFCNSDYGDTHELKVLTPASFEDVAHSLNGSNVGLGVLKQLYSIAGGFPNALQHSLDKWNRLKPEHLNPDARRQIAIPAETLFERCCAWLDTPPSNHWQDVLAGCVVGEDRDNRLAQAINHQWFPVLFEENSIKSEALISALMKAWAKRTLDFEGESQKAIQFLYRNKQYYRLELAVEAKGDEIPPHLVFVRFHSMIMARLFEAGESESDENGFKEARQCLIQARQFLQTSPLRIATKESDLILQRYDELLSFVNQVIDACKKDTNRRIVDVLLDAGREDALAAALLLLDERISSAARTLNHSAAVQLAVPLPEQIFRAWARLALEVDFYSAPVLDAEAFAEAAKAADEARSMKLKAVELGDRFPDFISFSYYCAALALRRQMPLSQLPATSLKELNSLLGETVDPRNSSGHAVVIVTQKTRTKFFKVIDRWKNCLHEIASTKINADASGLLQPLPLVDASGSVLW